MKVDQSKPSCLAEDNIYASLMTDSNTASSLGDLLAHYEEEMMSYIYAIPHIPPTMFELRLRHADVKGDVLKTFGMCVAENEPNKESLRARLANQIDKKFASLVVKNMHEYKVCQTGFIIGWKCSVNKPNNQDYKSEAIDDRF